MKSRKFIRNIIIFLILILLTFYFIFKDENPKEIITLLKSVKLVYVFIGISCILLYLVMEAINNMRLLKALGKECSFIRMYKYVFIQFFFAAITPAASGGQPMEIYYMNKDGIPVSKSTLTLIIQVLSFQIVTLTFGIISGIINHELLKDGVLILFIVGITINITIMIIELIATFNAKATEFLIKILIKFFTILHIKDIETKRDILEKGVLNYSNGSNIIKKNKILIIKTILTTCIQMLFYYSIPYFVLLSFGINDYNLIYIITLSSLVFATAGGIPLPGSVGVSEGVFIRVFKDIFTKNKVTGGMLLTRSINFYSMVIVGAIISFYSFIKIQRNN